jgi:hypothetical protein
MSEIPDGSAVITPLDMYKEIQRLCSAVVKLDAKLDGKLEKLDELDKIADHESRIRALERRSLALPIAGTAGVGGLLTAAWQALHGG